MSEHNTSGIDIARLAAAKAFDRKSLSEKKSAQSENRSDGDYFLLAAWIFLAGFGILFYLFGYGVIPVVFFSLPLVMAIISRLLRKNKLADVQEKQLENHRNSQK